MSATNERTRNRGRVRFTVGAPKSQAFSMWRASDDRYDGGGVRRPGAETWNEGGGGVRRAGTGAEGGGDASGEVSVARFYLDSERATIAPNKQRP